MEFFDHMPMLLKTFWFIAIPTSLIFLVQTIMTFAGADAGEGVEADFDSNLEDGEMPFQLFTLRNLINFLLGVSWTGISFYNTIESTGLLIGLSVLVGVLFVMLFFYVIRQLQKLSEDNSFKLTDTIGKNGEVYLSIPGQMNGRGKVLISVKGSVHELDAMTDTEMIASGKTVVVTRLENNNILIVKSL